MHKLTQTSALLCTIFTLSAAGCIPVHLATGSFEQSLDVDGFLTLGVTTNAGDITISSGKSGQLHVLADVTIEGSNKDQIAEMVEDIEQDPPFVITGDQIILGDLSRYDWADDLGTTLTKTVAISYILEVPQQTQAEALTGAGLVNIDGLEGPIYAGLDTGEAVISSIATQVTVAVGSGAIVVTDTPMVEAAISQGDTVFRNIEGSASLLASSSNLSVEAVGGDLTVDIDTGSTLIESALGEAATWKVITNKGICDLYMNQDASFYFQGQTGNGSIEIDLPYIAEQEEEGYTLATVGASPDGIVDISTGEGDIILRY